MYSLQNASTARFFGKVLMLKVGFGRTLEKKKK
jgi:hypothetical protein